MLQSVSWFFSGTHALASVHCRCTACYRVYHGFLTRHCRSANMADVNYQIALSALGALWPLSPSEPHSGQGRIRDMVGSSSSPFSCMCACWLQKRAPSGLLKSCLCVCMCVYVHALVGLTWVRGASGRHGGWQYQPPLFERVHMLACVLTQASLGPGVQRPTGHGAQRQHPVGQPTALLQWIVRTTVMLMCARRGTRALFL